MTDCAVCSEGFAHVYRAVDDVQFYKCATCGSVFADPTFLARVESGEVSNYQHSYWESELAAASERSYGSSLQRVAETFLYCRIPIRRFLDIGTGPGYLLDAASAALPHSSNMFYGVELFPPAPEVRSHHPNYKICSIEDTREQFEAGVCVEVIEHLTPNMLKGLAQQLAKVSVPGSLYLINSGQPEFVEKEDPAYLDPHGRGHIVAYSLAGAAKIFTPHGFTVIPLPGRNWAFLIEYKAKSPQGVSPIESLSARIWSPVPGNVDTLKDGNLGSLLYHAGRDAARAYIEYATVLERTAWAQGLGAEVERLRSQLTNMHVNLDRSDGRPSILQEKATNSHLIHDSGILRRAKHWIRSLGH